MWVKATAASRADGARGQSERKDGSMQNVELKKLADDLEGVSAITGDLEARIRAALATAGFGAPANLATVDDVLLAVDTVVPSWAVSLEGDASAEHGHWTCTLRKSRERDNDEVIGVGKGEHPAPALMAALIKVLSFRMAA
jgi:hypothetical protein